MAFFDNPDNSAYITLGDLTNDWEWDDWKPYESILIHQEIFWCESLRKFTVS